MDLVAASTNCRTTKRWRKERGTCGGSAVGRLGGPKVGFRLTGVLPINLPSCGRIVRDRQLKVVADLEC
jgi:hypothetical protein